MKKCTKCKETKDSCEFGKQKTVKTGLKSWCKGCSTKELKVHLESQFQEGMTWDNWSLKGWHIDHIKSLASFDLINKEELLKACNYTNLQPLWAFDNLSKGNRI